MSMFTAHLTSEARAAGLAPEPGAIALWLERRLGALGADGAEDAGWSPAAVKRLAAEIAQRLRAADPAAQRAAMRRQGEAALTAALAAAGLPAAAVEDAADGRVQIRFAGRQRAARIKAPDWGLLVIDQAYRARLVAALVAAVGSGR
ncbi:MAG: hypothetical protein N2690_00795 [Rhodocyclaceae bacterium]|nr:hypothetical protein [Rhodocyclaceae bacterium]